MLCSKRISEILIEIQQPFKTEKHDESWKERIELVLRVGTEC